MIVKKHITGDKRLILAICDEDLLGKVIEDGKKQIDLTAEFYMGIVTGEEETLDLMHKAYVVNAVGKDSVACCIKAKLVDEKQVSRIGGIPFVQLVFC
jgi:uncharacterized protein